MPFWDDWPLFAETSPRWMSRPLAFLGAVIGAGVGAWLGWQADGFLAGAGGFFTGAFVGFGAGYLLSAALFFVAIFLVVVAVLLGWEWLMGLFG